MWESGEEEKGKGSFEIQETSEGWKVREDEESGFRRVEESCGGGEEEATGLRCGPQISGHLCF